MEILIAVVAFVVGVLAGGSGTWWWMSREWQRNPYRLKLIVDGVIAKREAAKKKQ